MYNKNPGTRFFTAESLPRDKYMQNNTGNKKKINPEEMLKEIGDIVNMQEENAKKSRATINSAEYEQTRQQLLNIEKMLKKVPEESNEIKKDKCVVLTRITNTLKMLEENARQNNHKQMVESSVSKNTKTATYNFTNNSTSLDKNGKIAPFNENGVISTGDIVKPQTPDNQEKIELSSIKDALEKHTTVVQKTLHDLEAYQQEQKEILILQHRLDNITTNNSVNEKNKEELLRKVSELLRIVDQKISEEKEVQDCLTNLQQIDDQINNIRKTSSDNATKMKVLNDCRKKLSKIHNHSPKVNTKKIKVEANLNKPIEYYDIRKSQQDNMFKQFQSERSTKNVHQPTHLPSGYEDRTKTIYREANPVENPLKDERASVSKENIRRNDGENIKKEEIRSCINRLQNVQNEINNIAKLDINPITKIRNLEDCRRKLNDISFPHSEIDAEKSKILDKLQNHVENFKVEMNLENELHRIKTRIKKYEAEFSQLEHAKSNDVYQRKRDEIVNLVRRLENIQTLNAEIESEKTALSSKCTKILDILNKKTYENEETKKNVNILQRINDEVTRITTNNDDHSTKLNCLKQCRHNVNAIVNVNEEVQSEKRQLLAKILTLEENIGENIEENKKVSIRESSKSSLFKIQIQVDQRKQEVYQFKYPASSQDYKIKRKEISDLLEDLNNIPTEWPQEDKEKKAISKEIYQLLDILDKNADINEENLNFRKQGEINRCLQYIQNIENDVDDVTKSNLAAMTKLKTLFDYKMKVMDLKQLDNEVNNKKSKVISKINKIEEQLKNKADYNSEMKKIKIAMEKYKNESLNFSYPQSSKAYERKQREIFGLLQELESIQDQFELDNISEIARMKNGVNKILQDLKKKAYDNDLSDKYLELIQEIETEVTKIARADLDDYQKLQSLNKCKKQINSITTSDDEVLFEKQSILDKIETHEHGLRTDEKQASTISKTDISYEKQRYNNKVYKNSKREEESEKDKLEKIKSSIRKYEKEIQYFSDSYSSKAYMRKRDEIIDVLQELENINYQSESNKVEIINIRINVNQVLKYLNQKAFDNELFTQYMELIRTIEYKITEIINADDDEFDKLRPLVECKEKIIAIDTSNEMLCKIKKITLENIAKHEQNIETRRKHSGNVSETSKATYVSTKTLIREETGLK